MTAKQVEAAAVKLPLRDRLRLTRKIIQSLQTGRNHAIADAMMEELDYREWAMKNSRIS
jgi:hypothetical protein